jgi:hypothetical protein
MDDLVRNLNHPSLKSSVLKHSAEGPIEWVLNHSEMQTELRWLIQEFQASGPDLEILFAKHPELARRVAAQKIQLVFSRTCRAHLVWDHVPVDMRAHKDMALLQFVRLLLNPRSEYLGGPCARCGMYYLKKTKRQKVYCSRRCGTRATSISSNRKTRMGVHRGLVQRAQDKMGEWEKQVPGEKWKNWLSGEVDLSPKWLTRAVNKGELKPHRKISQ